MSDSTLLYMHAPNASFLVSRYFSTHLHDLLSVEWLRLSAIFSPIRDTEPALLWSTHLSGWRAFSADSLTVLSVLRPDLKLMRQVEPAWNLYELYGERGGRDTRNETLYLETERYTSIRVPQNGSVPFLYASLVRSSALASASVPAYSSIRLILPGLARTNTQEAVTLSSASNSCEIDWYISTYSPILSLRYWLIQVL